MKWVPILSGIAPQANVLILQMANGTYIAVKRQEDPVHMRHIYVDSNGKNGLELGLIAAYLEIPECPSEMLYEYITAGERKYEKMHD